MEAEQSKFTFKSHAAVRNLTADAVGNELERIGNELGAITPPNVVEASRPKDAVLHEQFTWHDPEAAHNWRLQEARQIIHSVQVIPEGCTQPVQAYVSVRVCEGNEDGDLVHRGYQYRAVDQVMANVDMRSALLAQLRGELKAMRRKHEAFTELANVWRAIDDMEE